MISGARQGGLSISKISCDSQAQQSLEFGENGVKKKQQLCHQKRILIERGQRRRAKLVEAERKVTVAQITRHCMSGMQKSISEHLEVDRLQQQKTNKSNNKYLMKCSLTSYVDPTFSFPPLYEGLASEKNIIELVSFAEEF